MARFSDLPLELLEKIAGHLFEHVRKRRQRFRPYDDKPEAEAEPVTDETCTQSTFQNNLPWDGRRTRLLRYRLISKRFSPTVTAALLERSTLVIQQN